MAKRKTGAMSGGSRPKLDAAYPGKGQVHGENGEWFDCMLNQTNVGNNNNKYYIIQLVDEAGKFACWTHWGRVGEPGQSSKDVGPGLEKAKKAFMSKFKAKTKNNWDQRAIFKPVAGKYTLIDMDHTKSSGAASKKAKKGESGGSGKSAKACTLPKPLHDTVNLIFSKDMFHDSMKEMGIDVDKMPLGNLSKAQVQKGRKLLEDIEKAVAKKQKSKFNDLSSKYYTAIPHVFGRKKPPAISTEVVLQKEFDLMNTLADISTGAADVAVGSGSHPDDVKYRSLNCKLKSVPSASREFKTISKYITNTKQRRVKILDVFEVDRKGESGRFKAHAKLKNRKLLWHGTSVAVVCAILKSGLRIMPHAGGRVGRGLYFASENGKSAGYVGTTSKGAGRWGGAPGIGYMFLVEAALGKEKEVDGTLATHKGSLHALKSAPKGFDCVVARGRTEPDPKADIAMKFEGNAVTVPQGKPKKTKWAGKSHFSQSEYLVYKESQARIRYMLKLKF